MTDETKLVVEASRTDSKSSMTKTLIEEERSNINYTNTNEINIINRKLQTTTSGLQKYLYKQLTEQVSKENSLIIADYILAQKIEVNLSDTYRANILTTLITISKFLDNKSFKAMTMEDILSYLNNLRNPEIFDPLHRWIGSYNEQRQRLAKFFKWLYNPEIDVSKRPTPTL